MTAMRRIVAGVDGSEYSLRALRWAVVDAGRHGAELLAPTTWTALPPPIASPYVDVNKAVDRQDGAAAAEQALQTVVANAIASNPPIVVEIVATVGHPAPLLTEQSRHAGLVVVGARGRGGIAGWLLGSVSQELLRHSFCPVAVVRSPDKDEVAAAEETLTSEWSRVVVGIDGSDYSKSALRWAAGESKTHNAELTVASVWTPPPTVDPPYGNIAWGTDLDPQLQATAILQTTVEEVDRPLRRRRCLSRWFPRPWRIRRDGPRIGQSARCGSRRHHGGRSPLTCTAQPQPNDEIALVSDDGVMQRCPATAIESRILAAMSATAGRNQQVVESS
jgi:nucleotide-binding universal stress UspA family protein